MVRLFGLCKLVVDGAAFHFAGIGADFVGAHIGVGTRGIGPHIAVKVGSDAGNRNALGLYRRGRSNVVVAVLSILFDLITIYNINIYMKAISIYVSTENYRALQARAKRLGKPVSQLIRNAMALYLQKEPEPGPSVLDLPSYPSGQMSGPWQREELFEEMISK